MTRSLELRVCIAHKSILALVGQGMKYCCRMALHAAPPGMAFNYSIETFSK